MVSKSQVVSTNEYLDEKQKEIQAQYIAQVLVTYDFTLNAIAGTLGNMEQECSLNPGLWQSQRKGNLNGGFGLTQWTGASKLIDWCNAKGYDYNDIDSQLKRIKYELDNGKQWISKRAYGNMTFKEFIKSEKSPEYLAEVFCYSYERPGDVHLSNRKSYAKKWSEKLKSWSLTFEGRCDQSKDYVKANSDAAKYYTSTSYGGLNPCILGNDGGGRPLWSGSVLPNCVGYAWGRAYEIMGKKPRLSTGDAGDWFAYNKNNGIYEYGNEPKLGAIMCWSGGHVAVVEKIEGDKEGDKFITSNYGWKYPSFYTKEFKISKDPYSDYSYSNSNGSRRNFQGFIYLPGNLDMGTPSSKQVCISVIDEMIKIAEAEVGYVAQSGKKCRYYEAIDAMHKKLDSSYQKLYWGAKNGADWCAGFVDWCLYRALGIINDDGTSLNDPELTEAVEQFKAITNHGPGGASCGYNIDYYTKAGTYFTRGSKTPEKGDEIFLYNKCHTGLVVDVKGSTVYTVEGNTGGGNGRVKKKSYSLSSGSINGYGRPNWDKAPLSLVDASTIPSYVTSVSQEHFGIAAQQTSTTQTNNSSNDVINNDFTVTIDVDGGGIPAATRGGTVNIEWINDSFDYTLIETVDYKNITHNAADTMFNIRVNQFYKNDPNAANRKFRYKDNNQPVDKDEIDNFLIGCSKVIVSNTQINIGKDNLAQYKDTATNQIVGSNDGILITGFWDDKSNKWIVPDGVNISNYFECDLKSAIPCMNIYINGAFKQCIPRIYHNGKWCYATPHIATKYGPITNELRWYTLTNLRGIHSDDRTIEGDQKGDYWDGTKWV